MMGVRLTELNPVVEDREPNEHGYQRITFLCPTCRKLRLLHAIWSSPHGEVTWRGADGKECRERVWQATQGPYRDWDTLSLTPSLDCPPHKRGDSTCPGWHGHIIDGEVRP